MQASGSRVALVCGGVVRLHFRPRFLPSFTAFRASVGVSSSIYDGFKCDKAFIATMSSNISLSSDTEQKLHQQGASQSGLPELTKADLVDKYNISLSDAVKIVAWSKEEERRKKEKNKKTVLIFDEVTKSFIDMYFLNDVDFFGFLSRCGISSLSLVDDKGALAGGGVLRFDFLRNGSRYSKPDRVREAVDVLRESLIREAKTKAERATNGFLSKYYGQNLLYLGSEIEMKGSGKGQNRGDVDTLFISEDGKLVVLLERKTTLSEDEKSLDELFKQLESTKKNFSLDDTIFVGHDSKVVSMQRGVNYDTDASIVSAVYFKSGPASVFAKLAAENVHVITDALEHIPPSTHTHR